MILLLSTELGDLCFIIVKVETKSFKIQQILAGLKAKSSHYKWIL